MKAYVLLLATTAALLAACRTARTTTCATDIQTHEKVLPQGYKLPAGKVCLVSTTNYPATLPGSNSFKKQASSFVYAGKNIEISSLKSETATIDTLVQNCALTTCALQSVAKQMKLPGNQCIPDYAYRDASNRIELDKIVRDQRPEVLINLKELSFHISGQSQTMAYVLTGIPNRVYRNEPLFPKNDLNGDLHLAYSALWEIILTDGMEAVKTIEQTGKTKVSFHEGLELAEELSKYAMQAGTEFAALIDLSTK